jgi:hypothetical protein
MFSKLTKALAVVTLSAASLPLIAGGFYLEFGNPSANSDPKVKNAVAMVRTVGCNQPERATLEAVAMRISNGKRESIRLTAVSMGGGSWYINREFPTEGNWVIAFVAKKDDLVTSALLPVTAKGGQRSSVKWFRGQFTDQELEQMLASVSAS